MGITALCIAMLLGLSSCGSSRKVSKGSGGYKRPAITKIDIDGSLPSETRALLAEAQRWLGTAYRYGGTSRSGVDCSGLTMNVFSNALKIKLPRNSAQQKQYCREINKRELIEGDLVFFATGSSSSINHVGMYIGDGRMIHASGSRGVMVSDLSEAYYVRNYHSSGRVETYYVMISGKKSKKQKSTRQKELPTVDIMPDDPIYAEAKPKPSGKKTDDNRITVPDVVKKGIEVIGTVDVSDIDRVLARAGGSKDENNETVTASTSTQQEDIPTASAPVSTATETQTPTAREQRKALNVVRRSILDDALNQAVDSIVSEYFD